jgi:hypothetical protein
VALYLGLGHGDDRELQYRPRAPSIGASGRGPHRHPHLGAALASLAAIVFWLRTSGQSEIDELRILARLFLTICCPGLSSTSCSRCITPEY